MLKTRSISSFVVYITHPVFHPNTDGYVGTRTEPYAFVGTLDKAIEVMIRETQEMHADGMGDDWDAPSFSIGYKANGEFHRYSYDTLRIIMNGPDTQGYGIVLGVIEGRTYLGGIDDDDFDALFPF